MSYPDAWGLSFEELMGLAWLAYKGNVGSGPWTIAGNTWNVRQIHEHGSFHAVLIAGPQVVLALSGTDDLGDWRDNVAQGAVGVSGQYLRALRLARATAPDVVIGHSLGGGMASYCAIYGRQRAATINPAPLNLNPISIGGMLRNHSLVINYIAPGEILQVVDALAPNMGVVGRVHNVSSLGGWNPVKRHAIGNLEGFTQPARANMGDFYAG